uniref:Uncharacterized protein n=1 Tax=Anguilla anguilla TaxID=7936 RepID=A0A0E9W8Q8_ANGAN
MAVLLNHTTCTEWFNIGWWWSESQVCWFVSDVCAGARECSGGAASLLLMPGGNRVHRNTSPVMTFLVKTALWWMKSILALISDTNVT